MREQFVCAAVLALVAVGGAQLPSNPHSTPGKPSQVAQGKYIVENVAMCSTCHTPRLANGQPDPKRNLMGQRMPASRHHVGRWAPDAPQIAGLPRWEDDEIVILLTTGKLETGLSMRPPMPQFHMTDHDARAVVAYLRSLAPAKTHQKKTAKIRRWMMAGVK